jgi:hemolysin III
METHRPQTPHEEKWNTITHSLGVVFTLISIPWLLTKVDKSGSQIEYLGLLLFGFGMMAVYLSSSLYHAVQSRALKRTLQIVDHVSIYFLIGGTYFPVVYQYTDTRTSTIFLIAQWVIILLGTIMKLFFTGKFEKISLFVYLFLGWSVVFLIKPFLVHMPFDVFKWIMIGGVAYTGGVIFYRMDHKKYAHAIWHLFVLSGTIAHYIAIYRMYNYPV